MPRSASAWMISLRCVGVRPLLAQLRRMRTQRAHGLGGVVGVPHDAQLLAVGVKLVDEMRRDLDLPAVEIEFSPLVGRRLDDVGLARGLLGLLLASNRFR